MAGGVEVGQLLDQLIGYFRDVMAHGGRLLGPDQMLYALPSQAEEVAEIGRQLGLQTVLAMVQILDQTAARMRVSMHGRTLVEMAVVRICQLDELDELRRSPNCVATGSCRPAEATKRAAAVPRPSASRRKKKR